MARGSIRKKPKNKKPYEAVVDLGPDPVTGKRRQRSKSFKTWREADRHLTTWQAKINQGTLIEPSQMTVTDLLEQWMRDHVRHNTNLNTQRGYQNTVYNHLVPGLGRTHLQKLTAPQLQQWYTEKREQGTGITTIRNCHRRLREALKMAQRLGYVETNATDAVKPPKPARGEMKTWTPEESALFLDVAEQSPHGPIWLLSLMTGMRLGELTGLRWGDIDFASSTLRVAQTLSFVRSGPGEPFKPAFGPPKTRSSRRIIKLSPSVVEALRQHRTAQSERRLRVGPSWAYPDLVFTSRTGTPLAPQNLRRECQDYITQSGVPRIRVHDQRHTYVTHMLAQGAPLKALGASIGHARTKVMLETYAHILEEQRTLLADLAEQNRQRHKKTPKTDAFDAM